MGIHLSTYLGPYIVAKNPKMKTEIVRRGKKCQHCDKSLPSSSKFCAVCGSKLIEISEEIEVIDYGNPANEFDEGFDEGLGERLSDISYFMSNGKTNSRTYIANIKYGSRFGYLDFIKEPTNLENIDTDEEIALLREKFSTEIDFISKVYQDVEFNFGLIQYWS